MTDPFKIALLGLWHVHADDYASAAAEEPDMRLAAVWDPDHTIAREAAARYGADVVSDLDVLLSRADIDGVIVTTATSAHPDVIGRAIAAGKHVFTEKLLAGTVGDAETLVAAAQRAGVALVVSLPQLANPVIRTAKRLVASGALGDLTYVRIRMAHDGWVNDWLPERFADPAAALGGALTDLGCHPVYLVQHFLGAEPIDVTASYGHVTGRVVEDNAITVFRYGGGALGVAEASTVTVPGAFALELRGTKAGMLHGFGDEALVAKGGVFGDEWVEVDLDPEGIKPFDAWAGAMRGGAMPDPATAVALTRAVVAANEAAV